MKNLRFIIAVFALSFVSSFAQEIDKPVTKLLKQYINASNNLNKTKEANTVLALFDDRYKNNTAYVGLSGVVKRTTTGFESFANQIDQNVKNRNYDFKMTIQEVVYEAQKERAGTVSALINFESKINGKVAEKGTILINLVASVVRGDWKIMHNNTVRVSEGSDVGNCVCYLLSRGGGANSFGAETYYPAGVEYNREYQPFSVGTRNGKRVVKADDKDYAWTENNDVLDGARKIGKATSPKEAIKVVLAHIYTDSCIKMDFN